MCNRAAHIECSQPIDFCFGDPCIRCNRYCDSISAAGRRIELLDAPLLQINAAACSNCVILSVQLRISVYFNTTDPAFVQNHLCLSPCGYTDARKITLFERQSATGIKTVYYRIFVDDLH